MSTSGATPNSDQQNLYGDTRLHKALEKSCSVDRVHELIALGADPNGVNQWNLETPLHVAAAKGNMGAVKVLIDVYHVNLELKDGHGCTPFLRAMFEDHLNTARALLQRGAKMWATDYQGRNIFLRTRSSFRILLIQNLLDIPEIAQSPDLGEQLAAHDNALFRHAVATGNIDFVKFLLLYPAVLKNVTANDNEAYKEAKARYERSLSHPLLKSQTDAQLFYLLSGIEAIRRFIDPEARLDKFLTDATDNCHLPTYFTPTNVDDDDVVDWGKMDPLIFTQLNARRSSSISQSDLAPKDKSHRQRYSRST